MREVKRYSPDALGDMHEGRHGEYVLASEFDRVFLELSEHKNGNVLALLRAGMASACDKRDALAAELETLRKDASAEMFLTLTAELAKLRAELAEVQRLREALSRACDVLKIMRKHEDQPNGYKYPVSLWFPAIDTLLAASTGQEVKP